jgi:hypothetical protein
VSAKVSSSYFVPVIHLLKVQLGGKILKIFSSILEVLPTAIWYLPKLPLFPMVVRKSAVENLEGRVAKLGE